MSEHTRLNKYISESGMCSRREADRFIENGVVFINGKRAKMGDQVAPGDLVKVNGMLIEPKPAEEAIYIIFNKPPGITTTTDKGTKDNIIDYISFGERIFPVGRLDKDSQGLIILTSDGDIVNKILRAGNEHEKEYLVTVNKPLTESFIKNMAGGVPILGVHTKKCKIKMESTYVFRITLIQGMNRQIRRMCEHFNYEVTKLERIRIMNLHLKGLALGEYRELKKDELASLQELIKDSNKTAEPGKAKKTAAKTPPKASPSKTFAKSSGALHGKKPAFSAPSSSFGKKKNDGKFSKPTTGKRNSQRNSKR